MFSFIGSTFNTIIVEPLFNLLIAVIEILPNNNLGLAVIIVTLLVRFVLYPFSQNSLKTQKKLMELRPKLKEIEKKYKDDKQKRAQEQLALYKENGVNPLGAISFPLFIQLPILIGLYQVFLSDFGNSVALQESLYFTYTGDINTSFFGIDLLTSSVILAVIAATVQFFQARSLAAQAPKPIKGDKQSDFQHSMNTSMMYILPLIIFVLGVGIPGVMDGFPAGIALYWTVTTVFSHLQQHIVQKKDKQEQAQTEQPTPAEQKPQQTNNSQQNTQPTHPHHKKKKKKRHKK